MDHHNNDQQTTAKQSEALPRPTKQPSGDEFDPMAFIANYQPKAGPAAQCWPQIGEFVRELTMRLHPTGKTATYRALWNLGGLAAFALSTGQPLDPERILTPTFINRYTDVAIHELGSRRTVRASLRSYGPRLTVKAPWEPKAKAIGRTHNAPPYTPLELSRLRNAFTYLNEKDRRRAEYVYVAGIHFGVDGRWLPRVAVENFDGVADGIHLSLDRPDRTVTCVFDAEDEVRSVLEAAPVHDDGRVFSSSRELNNFSARINWKMRDTPLHLNRLRSTWLVTHLIRNTPLVVVMYAAGLETGTALTDLLQYLPRPDSAGIRVRLRGVEA